MYSQAAAKLHLVPELVSFFFHRPPVRSSTFFAFPVVPAPLFSGKRLLQTSALCEDGSAPRPAPSAALCFALPSLLPPFPRETLKRTGFVCSRTFHYCRCRSLFFFVVVRCPMSRSHIPLPLFPPKIPFSRDRLRPGHRPRALGDLCLARRCSLQISP